MNPNFKILTAGLQWQGNIYKAVALRLLLVMILLSVCRLGFYFFNYEYFPKMRAGMFARLMWGGLTFDLVTLLYVNALFIVLTIIPFDFRFKKFYQTGCKYLFLVTNSLALGANVIDFIYYRFTLRRTTADVFTQFENENNLAAFGLEFLIDYWYAVLFWLIIVTCLTLLYNQVRITGPQLKNKLVYYAAGILSIPLVALLMVGGIRGGFKHSTRPITLSNAGEYVKTPRDISIVLNTPFAIIRTWGKTKVQKVKYFTQEETEKIYSPVHYPARQAPFQKDNVVVLILESFSKEFIGAFNAEKEDGTYKGYTPFLDSLIQHSFTFEYSFANGRKSIDGLPSIVSSIPSLGVPYFLSPYSGNRINSLASLLHYKGYHTSFFHGAPNGSMGFKAFMNLAGVDHYFGMNEYNNSADFDGMWGIWDEKFFSFYANKLNEFPQPFMSSFFSVSSHHPFKIPIEFERTFLGGPLMIHKCIQYTDYGLKKFFETVSSMPWYENTLFVITADHTSSEIQFDETRTASGFYSVPVIFFKPDHSLKGRDQTITQQIDIMPTILNYLNFDSAYVAFGRDAFSKAPEPFAFNFNDNLYQLFEDKFLLQFDGEKSVALYNFKEDKLLQEDLLNKLPQVQKKMETKIKAIIQQYNNRMIDNKLTMQ